MAFYMCFVTVSRTHFSTDWHLLQHSTPSCPVHHSGWGGEGNVSIGLLCVGWKGLHSAGKQRDTLLKATECHPWGVDTVPALWQVPHPVLFPAGCAAAFLSPIRTECIWVPISQRRNNCNCHRNLYKQHLNTSGNFTCYAPQKIKPLSHQTGLPK